MTNNNQITGYVGRVIKGQVIVFCERNGEAISVPSIYHLQELGLVMTPLDVTEYGKQEGIRHLTKNEVNCFLRGVTIEGERVKTPAELEAEHQAAIAEMEKDPQLKAILEKIRKGEI